MNVCDVSVQLDSVYSSVSFSSLVVECLSYCHVSLLVDSTPVNIIRCPYYSRVVCIGLSFSLSLSLGSVLTLDKLQPVKLTVVAAGVVFVLVSLLWPCGWLWNQWNKTCGCSFAPFLAYTWALSLVYTAIVGALIFGVNEHYSCIHFCKNCTFSMDEHYPYPCQFVQMSLWTLVAMIALMIAVVFITFCYCCCNCSCRKQRRGYSML